MGKFMKKLLENFRQYLKEETELFGVPLNDPRQNVFISKDEFTGMRPMEQSTGMKPKGLWYSCGDEWIDWVSGEMPEWLAAANYLYEIEISDDVYEIVSAKGLRQFENLYGVPMGGGMLQIDWKKVQDDGWAGIQICPYRGEARYSSMWYYGWDVASGCIWDPAGLTSFKLLGTRGDEE